MRIPGRGRKAVVVGLCLAAVVAIGWGGRVVWRVWDGHRQIDAACGELVPAGRVLDLSEAGGTITHRVLDDDSFDPDTGIPHDCEIYSTEAGERAGTDTGTRWFFTGEMGVLPSDEPRVADAPRLDWGDDVFGRTTYPPEPLGGGIAGQVTASSVTVQLACEEGKAEGRAVKALWARAQVMPPRGGKVSRHDRDILADTAVETANNLAERLGCADRLPDAPDAPALKAAPVPAERAEGTCAWYGKSGLADRSPYPDEVVESRTDGLVWDESCRLVVDFPRAEAVHRNAADRHDRIGSPDLPGEWFAAFRTYAGPVAENVRLTSAEDGATPEPAAPGKAGRSSGEPVWWASSVCDGRPQIHTMTLSRGYADLVASRMEDVFRAYVADVTTRRRCTDVVLPGSPTFRTDRGESR